MASKSKKKLQFLIKEKSEEINEKNLQAKEIHIEDFELKFKETYRTYLEQFPERKILFEYAQEALDMPLNLNCSENCQRHFYFKLYISIRNAKECKQICYVSDDVVNRCIKFLIH